MKFNRSLMTMAVVSAFTVMISGCNKDSNSSSPTTPSTLPTSPNTGSNSYSLIALGGEQYLSNADVFLDSNHDGKCDQFLGKTDSQGAIKAKSSSSKAVVCVRQNNPVAVKAFSNSNVLSANYVFFQSKLAYGVVSPITDIAVKENLTKEAFATKLGLDSSKVFHNYLSDSDDESYKAKVVARSLVQAQKQGAKERELLKALATSAGQQLLGDVTNLKGKTLNLDKAGNVSSVVAFDQAAYKKQVNSAPECGEWHLPEHMTFLPQQQILESAVLDSDIQKFIAGKSPSDALDTILSNAPDSMSASLKADIKQCSSITTSNTVHDFSNCAGDVKSALTEVYRSDEDRIRMICRVTKPQINIAVIPVVVDGYALQSNSIRQEVVARFGEQSNVDKYLESTLAKDVQLTVATELNVTGLETNDDNKVLLPYKDQIFYQSILAEDGSKLDITQYDQLAFVYIAKNNPGLSNYGNIYETVTLQDGTVLKNRFLINSDLTSQSRVSKLGLDSENKSLSPDQVLFAHEYLHGLGLGHASVSPCSYKHFSNTGNPFNFDQSCDWNKTEKLNKEVMEKFHKEFDKYSAFNYGVYNGVMGGKGEVGQEVLPYFQYRLGRVNPSKVSEVNGSKTLVLNGFDPTKNTLQLIHLNTKNGHFWLWFNTENNRFDWMMENPTLVNDLKLSAPGTPEFSTGITLASISTNEDETIIIIPNDYTFSIPNDPLSLKTDKSLFTDGTYTIDNVELTVSTKSTKAKTIQFVFK